MWGVTGYGVRLLQLFCWMLVDWHGKYAEMCGFRSTFNNDAAKNLQLFPVRLKALLVQGIEI